MSEAEVSVNARTVRVEVDMNKLWMQNNPELAGLCLIQFFIDHPPEEWELTIVRAYMPGAWLTLKAALREDKP